jgi:hypothetical protein
MIFAMTRGVNRHKIILVRFDGRAQWQQSGSFSSAPDKALLGKDFETGRHLFNAHGMTVCLDVMLAANG